MTSNEKHMDDIRQLIQEIDKHITALDVYSEQLSVRDLERLRRLSQEVLLMGNSLYNMTIFGAIETIRTEKETSVKEQEHNDD